MRILAVSQYYWPEPFNVSEICEELVSRGHEVTVLTGLPNYPEGELYPGYEHGKLREQERNGVKIVRSWLWPRKRGAVNRFLNYETFSWSATNRSKKLKGDFDIVLSFEISPIMSANPALAYARRKGVPCLLYVIDIWPECLLAGGITRESPIFRHYAKVSAKIYRSADRLAVTSPLFIDYISNLVGERLEACYLPQFAEDIFEQSGYVAPDGYPAGVTNLTFAGNVGAAQSVDTIIRAAALLPQDKVLFHVVGSGSELDSCKSLAVELNVRNVVFHGRKPLEDMPNYYFASDAMLATFSDNPVLGYTLPRKIQSYLAAGKPVLGTLVGESRRVIEEAGCGICCEASDYNGLAHGVSKFIAMSDVERKKLGINARNYYTSHFSRSAFFEGLEHQLDVLKGRGHVR